MKSPSVQMNLDHIFESEPYRELIDAIRTRDYARSAAIVNAQIAQSGGPEHLFWRCVRVELSWQTCRTPADYAESWPELERIYRLDPGNPLVQQRVLALASHVLLATERGYPPWVRELRPGLRLMRSEGAQYWTRRALWHELQRRWLPAYRAYSKAIACHEALPDAQKHAFAGRLVFLLAGRAICGLACKQLATVKTDIELSSTLLDQFPRNYMSPLLTALAQAELALFEGRFRDARTALQQGLARNAETAYARLKADKQVRVELFAARLARAEGNLVSFEHFAKRALAIATEHGLPMSAAAVKAVMAGAEY